MAAGTCHAAYGRRQTPGLAQRRQQTAWLAVGHHKSSYISTRREPETAADAHRACFTCSVVAPEDYVQFGREAILHLLGAELAVPWIEIEAKVADRTYVPLSRRVDPHHLSAARAQLVSEGAITSSAGLTRGGSEVILFHLPGAAGRRFDDVMARKRLLTARYYGWARGTSTRPGRFGPAGEAAVRDAMTEAAPSGYTIENPGREVETLLGVSLHGPLDAAAHYLVRQSGGIPGPVITVPVEVKNLRDWIYPSSREIYQLLSKAAALQTAAPDRLIAPVLVCRRAHITTMRMAKEVGFFVIPIERQYVHQVDGEFLTEVRTELGLFDLVQMEDTDDRLVRFFHTHLPKVIERTAADWSVSGPGLAAYWSALQAEPDAAKRAGIFPALRSDFEQLHGSYPSGW
jgi:hypothetical protein